MDMLRQARVGELLLSTVSTLASVAYGKLEEGDLAEAKLAIDAIGALSAPRPSELDAGHRARSRAGIDAAAARLRRQPSPNGSRIPRAPNSIGA